MQYRSLRCLWGLILCITLLLFSNYASSFEVLPTNQWIVKKHDSSQQSWDEILSELEISHKNAEVFGHQSQYLLVSHILDKERFKAIDSIQWVQKNHIYSHHSSKDKKLFNQTAIPWALENKGQEIKGIPGKVGADIRALNAWNIFEGSPEIVVALIDSGVNIDHPYLRGRVLENTKEIAGNDVDDDQNGLVDDVYGWNFVDNNNNLLEGARHGTFIAGILVGNVDDDLGYSGVLHLGKILPIKFLDKNGYGTTVNAIKAIEYAVSRGAKVINASWGQSEQDMALENTLAWAGSQGVLVVASSGNSGVDNDMGTDSMFPASSSLSNVISVSAYNHKDEIWEKSNFGSESVDIGAPGENIYSLAEYGFRYGSGTSFATAFVSAAVALVGKYQPDLSALEVRDRVLSGARPLSFYDLQKSQTGGVLNLYNALLEISYPKNDRPQQWESVPFMLASEHPYANESSAYYEVSQPGANYLRIVFSRFETERCCDKLRIKDKWGNTVREYSGNLGRFTTVEVAGDELHIEFVSDYIFNEFGFEVEAYEWSSEPLASEFLTP